MSAELYERFAFNNRVDQAIAESEEEYARTGESIEAKKAFAGKCRRAD